MFNRLQLNVKEMQIVANWSTHETNWKNYTKLNLTKARNTGSSGQAALFPILKGLKAEIIFPYIFGKEKGYYLSSTFHSLQGKILPIVGSRLGLVKCPFGVTILAMQEEQWEWIKERKNNLEWWKILSPSSEAQGYLLLLWNMQHHRLVISVIQAGKARLWSWLDSINQSQQQKQLLFPVTHKIIPSLTFLMNVGGIKCLKCEFSQSFRCIPPAAWQCYFNQTTRSESKFSFGDKGS